MNTLILNQYNINFEILIIENRKVLNISSHTIPYFSGYFAKLYPEFLINEIIPEVEQAILEQPFEEDAGGVYDFLRLGNTMSYFYNNDNEFAISTLHLKEILLSYIEWINENNLIEYI